MCVLYFCVVYNRQVVKELLDLLSQDRAPVGNARLPPVIDPSVQRHLTHFSAITHGFGTPALVASLTTLQSYLNESVKVADRQLHQQCNNAGRYNTV